MNIGTTSIDSLPLSPQSGDNIRLEMNEPNVNVLEHATDARILKRNIKTARRKHINKICKRNARSRF